MYLCMYIYIYISIYVCIYIYIYRNSNGEKEEVASRRSAGWVPRYQSMSTAAQTEVMDGELDTRLIYIYIYIYTHIKLYVYTHTDRYRNYTATRTP